MQIHNLSAVNWRLSVTENLPLVASCCQLSTDVGDSTHIKYRFYIMINNLCK